MTDKTLVEVFEGYLADRKTVKPGAVKDYKQVYG